MGVCLTNLFLFIFPRLSREIQPQKLFWQPTLKKKTDTLDTFFSFFVSTTLTVGSTWPINLATTELFVWRHYGVVGGGGRKGNDERRARRLDSMTDTAICWFANSAKKSASPNFLHLLPNHNIFSSFLSFTLFCCLRIRRHLRVGVTVYPILAMY